MLFTLSTPLSPVLRSSRTFAIVGLGAATLASWVWYRLTRQEPDPEEMERERRAYLASAGRIVDGSITDTRAGHSGDEATPDTVIYRYRIAGVTYECAQDVSPMPEQVRHLRIDLPIQVRFDPRNPGDSIVVAEGWSGLRLNPEHESRTDRESVEV